HLGIGTPEFYRREEILKDVAVPGSVQGLQELAQHYDLVYIGARPTFTLTFTEEWQAALGFPPGPVYLGETQAERLVLVKELRGKFDFIAGIGDRWDDNELHAEIGCLSIILQEHAGDWAGIPARILKHQRAQKVKENELHLRGKIEGLARVLPRLHAKYGDELWETYFQSVLQTAALTREERAEEDRASFAGHGLNPADLRDVAQWEALTRTEEWEHDSAFGLQDTELVEATERRYVHRVTRCRYAELWREHGHPDIGYQVHCRCDAAWWDHPAWNPNVRFEQPQTLMQGAAYCLFVQYLPDAP
ncbi:MAG TPA: L-2-amino-thiazoline-4-carboxylic acid hydrolase, partial [Anaerolineae bacterium]|nr:L-2-amino-thiazoline-4-carboxylic acid hydrolase [Anaerolineae bacterium]